MMKIAIHQPNYIPWLGYFYKIYKSDYFVFLDDAQFSNEGMHNFHYIKTPQGRLRLKIPVQQTLGDKIMDVRPKDELNWKKKHLGLIEHSYRKSKYFNEVLSDYYEVLIRDYNSLSELNSSIIKMICGKFGIKVEFVNSSYFNLLTSREEKVIDICTALGGEVYFSGTGAQIYQREDNFTHRGIELKYVSYCPFEYEQCWKGFISNVSVLDYLFNCGYDWENVLRHQER